MKQVKVSEQGKNLRKRVESKKPKKKKGVIT